VAVCQSDAEHPATPSPLTNRLLDAILVVCLLALTFLFGCFKQKDADIWWHLKAGQMIRQLGTVPRTDWFTFTSSDRPWVDLHWLFQVCAARIYAIGGLEMLTALSAALGAVAVGIQLAARHCRASVPVTVACWYAFLFLLSGRLYVRPEVVTLVCLSSFLALLFRADRHPRWLIALIPIQVLWVNVQGLFILGLLLAGVYWIDGLWRHLRRQSDARMGMRSLLVVGLTVASLASPYRLEGLLFPIELFRKMSWDAAFYGERISELQSIPQFIAQAGFGHFYVVVHFALLGLAFSSFIASWLLGRFSLFRVFTFIVFAWLSFQATRNSGQFALVAGALTVWNVGEWLDALRKRRSGLSVDRSPNAMQSRQLSLGGKLAVPSVAVAGRLALAALLVGTSWFVGSGRFYAIAGEGRLFGLGEHPLWHGHAGAQFAAQPGMPRRLLAFHLGQSAVFEFHMRDDQHTFADPRLEVVSRNLLAEYHAIESAIGRDDQTWRSTLRRHGLDMILVDHESHSSIDATLLSAPDWRCVYFDPVVAVFLQRDAASELSLAPIDFRLALFQDRLATEAEHGAAGIGGRIEEPARNHREAAALFRIAGSLISRERRGQVFDLQLARSILLHAASRSQRSAAGRPDRQFELDRLRGQISLALHPLAAVHSADEPYGLTSNGAAMLDLARARYFLERAARQRPTDFSTLAHLYELAKAQRDRDARRGFADELARIRPRGQVQRDVLRSVLDEVHTLGEPLSPSLEVRSEPSDPNVVRQLTNEYLAANRPQLAQSLLRAYRDRSGGLPWDLAVRLANISLLLGEPGIDLESGKIIGNVNDSDVMAHRGTAQLVMGLLDSCIESYQAALQSNPNNPEANLGLARAYLEQGDADSLRAHCESALELPNLDGSTRYGLEWMADLARL
jgi:tetratricopeptide (TPR) repeat protein